MTYSTAFLCRWFECAWRRDVRWNVSRNILRFFWLNGHLKPEKKRVRLDSLQEMRMWCSTTGKNSRQSTSAGAVCHVPCRDKSVVKPGFGISCIWSEAEPNLWFNSFIKALYFAYKQQLGKYWQWQITHGIRYCTHGNLLVTDEGKAILEYLLKLDWLHCSFLFLSPSGCLPSIFVSLKECNPVQAYFGYWLIASVLVIQSIFLEG